MKTAIILASMGGPDSLKAVRPFLFNLFSDPAIIRLPSLPRFLLAALISRLREKTAQALYQKMGGCSLIREYTEAQATALEKELALLGNYRCFVGMSYWHPLIKDTMKDVKKYSPDRIIILPLYPQSSTTTTTTVLRDVSHYAKKSGIAAPIYKIKNFYLDKGFIKALCDNITEKVREAERFGLPLLLFSAHGLPEKIVAAGDTYPARCQETVSALAKQLKMKDGDFVLCYQSRVGPMKWMGPSTEDEIIKAALTQRPIIVVPISFVCENAETTVELDMDYRAKALHAGAVYYGVVRTVGTKEAFIQGLAERIAKINQN